MKLSLFKKEPAVSLDDLHEKPISPKRDWLILISIFSGVIIIAAIFSTILFYNTLSGDSLKAGEDLSGSPDQTGTINTPSLEKSVEFLQSRS